MCRDFYLCGNRYIDISRNVDIKKKYISLQKCRDIYIYLEKEIYISRYGDIYIYLRDISRIYVSI